MNKPSQAPKYFQRFLQWFCHPDFYEELAGDLEEALEENTVEHGAKYARAKYRKEVLKLFRPSVFKEFRLNYFTWISLDMLKNYLKIGFRNLRKDKISASINIVGLSLGFVSALVILLYVHRELQVDTSFEQGDRVYRLINDERPHSETGRLLATVGPPFAPTLAAEYAEVEKAVRLRYTDNVVFKAGAHQYYENDVIYADKDFFALFSFPLAKGDPATVLAEPNSIVLTPEMAQKYFGEEDPVGKSISMNEETPLRVTGVLKEDPQKTHLDFDFLISFETFRVPYGYPVTLESWGWISFHAYVLLKEGVDAVAFDQKLAEFAGRHMFTDRPVRATYHLQALSDVYFQSQDMMNSGEHKHGSLIYTYGLLSIAFLILLVAGFNFMNISTARSIRRAGEVGMRKVLGARRVNLIVQFISEALAISAISVLLALFLFELSRDPLFTYLNWQIDFSYSDYLILIPLLIGGTFLLGILSAIYPSILLSSFKPLQVLKGKIKSSAVEMNIRKVLVVLQFTITIGLIVASLLVSQQMEFIRNKDLGFDREQVISLQMRTDDFLERYQLGKQLFGRHPQVLSISAGDVINGDYGSVPMTPAGAEEGIAMHWMGGYFDYCGTLGLELLEGRDFSNAHPMDTLTGIIINESAQRVFGWEEPLGKGLQVNSNINGQVIGVVKDFHMHSLHDPIEPMVMTVPRTHMRNILLRIRSAGEIDDLLPKLQEDWRQMAPDLPFQFSFLDDSINLQYESDRQFSRLITFFGGLAIFIAGLGLYGLIAIISSYKIKEIGIRKVLGASVMNIYVLLCRNFIVMVIIANAIALPLAWWVVNGWLDQFSYHTEPTYSIFIWAILISLGIALASLSYQVVKTALANPIKAIRHE